MPLSPDKRRRYVFLDRMHHQHFFTELFMPWWYDVRFHIQPRRAYMEVGKNLLYKIRRPLTVGAPVPVSRTATKMVPAIPKAAADIETKIRLAREHRT